MALNTVCHPKSDYDANILELHSAISQGYVDPKNFYEEYPANYTLWYQPAGMYSEKSFQRLYNHKN